MKPKGLTTLEKVLIALFVLLTAVCIGLIVVCFVDVSVASSDTGGCGTTQKLSGSSGSFATVNYPSNYDDNKNCMWEITVSEDKVIHLWFEEFLLEDSPGCRGDHVTVSDNLATLGNFCGHTKPKNLVSVGNKMYIYFASNSGTTDKGFKAFYEAIDPSMTPGIAGAGGHLQGETGELKTFGFPVNNYLNDALYQWKISVATNQRIRLAFVSFALEPAGTAGCNDAVEVYDGSLGGSALLGRFCGIVIPSPLVSSSNSLVIRFRSNGQISASGFQAKYIAYQGDPPTEIPPTSAPADSGCNSAALQKGRKGTISSRDYPNSYPANLRCSWDITVAEGLLVQLSVEQMAIEGSVGQCGGDRLEVADAVEAIGTYCGYLPPPVIISTSNRLFLTFSSDASLSDAGFVARWEAVHPEDIQEIQGCGGSFSGSLGVIKSPRWPESYPANKLCVWNIEAPPGKTLNLIFTHFDLEDPALLTRNCLDYVTIYDTLNNVVKYGPFCGTTVPPVITSRGQQLMLRLLSDPFTEGKGFRAYWTVDPQVAPPTEAPPPPNPWDSIPIDWPNQCGIPAIPPQLGTPRIVNGQPATPHSWPWQVSMQVWPASRNETVFFHTCGGTLIHKNWVLTAAHCFINYANELQRWQMCLGKHNLTYNEPNQQCFKVKGIYRHEKFAYPDIPTVEYDIALVRLDGDVTPNDYIAFACLPPNDEVLMEKYRCYATGWGDETGNSLAPKAAEALNQVVLPVIVYETCKRVDYWWFQVKASMICAGYTAPEELRSVCQGDSGGPYVCQSTQNNSTWEIHGITSFGALGCVVNKKPSVFTRTSAYITWIEQQLKKYTYDITTSGCGSAKDLATEGTLSSMSFPSNYKNNASCTWHITAPPGKVIHLFFTQFSLEDSAGCLNDKVVISDGLSSLGSHCGNSTLSDTTSFSNVLSLQFMSNGKVVDRGFSAGWKFVDPSSIPALSRCGGQFSTDQGEFKTPDWPTATYPNGHVCTWSITTDPSKLLRIVFTHFELQAVNILNQCVDYVEVYDSTNFTTLGKFCGFLAPAAINVPGSGAVIRFFSNRETQYKGFRGYWTTDPNIIPTLPPKPANPWDGVVIDWPANCGSPAIAPKSLQPRIANGVEATPHSWPWQVSVQSRVLAFLPFQHRCGGSLIHEEWILLAARCMSSASNLNLWQVCLGKHNTSTNSEPSQQCYGIDAVIPHEDFTYATTNDHSNDVALVHLKVKANLTSEVSPICLPATDALLAEGTLCYATGWGATKGALIPVYSKVLMQALLPVIPYETCSKPKHWWDQLRPSMICAGYLAPDQPKSACEGDTGGPLACNSTATNKWEVQGIVSFSAFNCLASNKPPVFTRVSSYRDWIEDKIKKFTFENQSP